MENKAEQHRFSAETGRVLQLMIHSLYTNRDIFLRELISNASDACDKLRFEAIAAPTLLEDAPELAIRIHLHPKERVLEITDNGIGMDREELMLNLGTIARSGTQRFLEAVGEQKTPDLSLIGQFGVGFYSAFMVAEKVEVISRKAGETHAHRWVSDGLNGFTVEEYEAPTPRGTRVRLFLKPGEDRYLDSHALSHIARTYSDHIGFPILLAGEDGAETRINRGAALWTRPKTEITQEQYNEFFQHAAHMPGAPWLTLHVAAEGTVSYRCLLFVPERRPFDLFHPDRRRRVKLYVKRVFITEEGLDLIPHYLRFVQGVIDSEDLPLNISRESLQHNPVLARICESVEKKLLQELKKKADADPESYARFWEQFGGVVKEGLCEAAAPKELILETCRFHSTHDETALTGLDAYLSRMKPGQEQIFYLTGDHRETLLKSPQIEGFRARGLEVLLLTDHVDDFWVNTVQGFKGKTLHSVTRAEVDLEQFPRLTDSPSAVEPIQGHASLPEAFLAYVAQALEGQVREVRVSKKLTESPVCLAIHEGAMESRLEKFLLEHKQLPSRALKILELNPQHPLIRTLAERYKTGGNDEELRDAVLLLCDQAKILEGEEIEDAQGFARRIGLLLVKGMGE